MPPPSLFISYSHVDMSPVDWLERLRRYLAPLRRREVVDIWDDSRLRPGSDWRAEIRVALDAASAAILLVGPGFLASDFINDHELPALLAAAGARGTRIYPLVVGYCGYSLSELERYQAFNDPEQPLEALAVADQNKTLNAIALAVDKDLRESAPPARAAASKADSASVLKELKQHLETTRTAFVAQIRRRDELVKRIVRRLDVTERLQYENFFFRYYGELDREEKFQFDQIRAITEGQLNQTNRKILDLLEEHPALMDDAPLLKDLRQHLVFWLNKYERVFEKRPEMCLLYTGVEDGVPFPAGVDKQIDALLKSSAGKS